MLLKVKTTHPNAQLPRYATPGAACFDLHAVTINNTEKADIVYPGHPALIDTGLAFEVPPGYMLEIRSRSGLAFGYGVTAFPGVIDSDYRGTVRVMLTCSHLAEDDPAYVIRPGDRIAQACLVRVPQVEFELVDELSPTERGDAGFGSTGVL